MAFIPQGGLPIVPALGFGFQRRVPDLYTAYQQGIPMLFQFDNYNLRGKDVEKLYNLRVSTGVAGVALGKAMFCSWDFGSEGFLSEKKDASISGIRRGEAWFTIPSVEAPFRGTWIAVDEENADDKTKFVFQRAYTRVKEMQFQPRRDLTDIFHEMMEEVPEPEMDAEGQEIDNYAYEEWIPNNPT